MRAFLLAGAASIAALSFAAPAAFAQSLTLNGGGGSGPQPIYDAEFAQFTSTTPTTLFSYDGIGAGGGQSAFLNNNIALFNQPSEQYGTIVGTTVHFAASDQGLTSSQISGYTLAATDGPVIQVPTLGVGVTIPYVNAGLTKALTLSDAQLCGVLSGQITNWSQLSKKATAGTIEVVYRSDSSAQTYLLTQHLNAVCTASNSSFPVYPVLITKTFAQLFTSNKPPATFTGESGSAAQAAQLLATPLSFGYISPDWTSIAPKSSNTTSLKVASLINGINNIAYSPTVTNIEAGLENPGPGSANTTPPSTQSEAANQLLWIPTLPQTNKGYSIVGYSTWEVSSCYASATVGTNIINFLNDEYAVKTYQTIIKNYGYAPLSNTAAAPYITAVTNTFLNNKNGYNLNIDNATLCSGLAGR
jgi:ABC-type phosphate transport system substrate-binding protein